MIAFEPVPSRRLGIALLCTTRTGSTEDFACAMRHRHETSGERAQACSKVRNTDMNNILEIRDLHVNVDGRRLLKDVDLTIADGEIHALLGPNGCGKTTLMMTIMGFPQYKVTQGQILFEGRDVTGLDLTERARLGIGIAQQRPPTIAGVKLQQIVEYLIKDEPERAGEVGELVKAFNMERLLDRGVNANFSGGEIKRSEIFQLLVSRPRFVMLDEPDSGVDLEALHLVGDLVNALLSKEGTRPVRRKAGLIITHTSYILDHVHADKAHIMLDGTIGCSGNPNIMIEEIRKRGYEECVRCIQRMSAATEASR